MTKKQTTLQPNRSPSADLMSPDGSWTDDATAQGIDGIVELLNSMGLSPRTEEGIADTPMRVLKFMREFRQPFDPEELLGKTFHNPGYKGMVVQSRIPFKGMCEHHLAPIMGHAAVGYVPSDHVVGLSKIARLVMAVGRERPSLQEGHTQRIADLIDEHLDPKGVICVIEAEHGCMACRGVNISGVITSTSAMHGIYRDVPAARDEFFTLIGRVEVSQ